jgi:phosphatidylserine synthase
MVPCAFFALAAAMRLARFNSESSTPPGWFSGVPTTLAGAIVATGVILLVNHPAALDESERYLVLTASVVVLGIAMISRLNFPKPRKSGRRSLNIVLSVNLVAIYVVGALRLWPEYLFVVALLYLAIGLIAGSRITIRS